MSVGDSSQQAVSSYMAVFRETTWGVLPTGLVGSTNATALEFLSCNFKTDLKTEKLPTLGFRGMVKRVQLDKSVMGSFEAYLHPHDSVLLTGLALGGTVVSTSLTGAYTHSITAGDIINGSIASVTFNVKKGDEPFYYQGGRVNSMKISANAGEVAKVSFDMVFKDSTIGAADIGSSLSYSSVLPFTFVQGTFRLAPTEASLTSTMVEPIQGFELTVKNNYKTDGEARQLGSNVLGVLPPTGREVDFKIKQRFDTSTTFNRFIQDTMASVQLVFTGASITSEHSYKMTVTLPKVYARSGDPEISGRDAILSSEIDFDVLMDTQTSTGREIGITFINNVASYTAL